MSADARGPVPILFVHHGGQWIRGSERILIDHIAHLDRTRFTPVVWTNCRPLAEIAAERGWPVACDEFSVLFDYTLPRFDLRGFLRLRRRAGELIRTHRIGLVHCNASESCQWMVPAARAASVPVVVHLHNDNATWSRTVQLVHQASAIVGGCEAMLAPYREEGVAPRFLRIIYNNVDTARIDQPVPVPRTAVGLSSEHFVFAAVGSLIPRKGMDVLIKAFASVHTTHPRTRLVIIGDGPERDALGRLAVALGLVWSVLFLGESATAPALVRDLADVCVLTSWWEGFPLALLEAGYFGRPLIASNVGGVPDLVKHGETGLLVPPGDVRAVSDAMHTLVQDTALRERLGASVARHIRNEMLAPANTRQLEALYSECIAAQRAGELPWWRWYPGYTRLLRKRLASLVRRPTRLARATS